MKGYSTAHHKERDGIYRAWEYWRFDIMDSRMEWARSKDRLVSAVVDLGFPKELGEQIAKQLGSPKAMDRMLGYLYNVKPESAELIVDEMLAILSDIERWREKKASEEANARYNEILNYGLGNNESPYGGISDDGV